MQHHNAVLPLLLPRPLLLCGTNPSSYTLSSVVGTTSSAVAPFTPARLSHCSSSAARTNPHRPARPRRGRRNELVLRRPHRTDVSVSRLNYSTDTHTQEHTHIEDLHWFFGFFFFTNPCSSVSDSPTRSPDHGGEKWPAELPRERGSQQTRAHEPVRDVGDRWILPELHPEVRLSVHVVRVSFKL